MLTKLLSVLTVVSLLIVALLTTSTIPSQIGPFGILMLFVAMYVSVLGVVTFLILSLSRLTARLSRTAGFSKPIQTFETKEAYYYATIIALGPVMLIGMQSVGEIGLYEFALVLLFTVLGCVYIARKTN